MDWRYSVGSNPSSELGMFVEDSGWVCILILVDKNLGSEGFEVLDKLGGGGGQAEILRPKNLAT